MIWLIRYLRNSVWENRLQDIRYWKEDICMPVLNEEYDVVVVGAGHAGCEAALASARLGLYYFMWSVDDTGSPNYHVAYGTSKSPLGPIKVAKKPVVLIQDPAKEIYGPAHNAVLQIPGTDEWYIVYHRINKNFIDREKGPGVHREVCIDRMEFNPDGTIRKVVPTL